MSEKKQMLGLSDSAFHASAGFAALAGLCPLIPVPFLDDALIERVRVQMYQKIADETGTTLSSKDARFLAARTSGVLDGVVKTLVLWPVKKIIRKVAYFLSIKRCADVAAAVFHEAWLFARAIEQGYIDRAEVSAGDHTALRNLRKALIHAEEQIDLNVTRQSMRAAFGASRTAIAPLLEQLKQRFGTRDLDAVDMDAAEREAAPLRDRIEAELVKHWKLNDQLDEALRDGYETSARESRA